jgi:formylglycine-generating enzyme required for sulfatase activity
MADESEASEVGSKGRWRGVFGTFIFATWLLAPAGAPAARGEPAGGKTTGAAPSVTWVRHPARPFAVTATEITVAQFRACVDARACDVGTVNAECNYGRADRADHPVNCVTYHGAEQYCAHAGGRLCTETEWLDACRGTDGRAFPYGTTFDAEACNVRTATAAPPGGEPRGTVSAGSLRSCEGGLPGLFDMAGNVAEWVESCDGTYCKFRGAGYISNEPVDLFAGCSGVCSGNDKGFQSGVVGIRCCRNETP